MTVTQDQIFRLSQMIHVESSVSKFLQNKGSHKSRQHKNIGGNIREAVAERCSKLSIGLQCYLETFLALGLGEASGLLL